MTPLKCVMSHKVVRSTPLSFSDLSQEVINVLSGKNNKIKKMVVTLIILVSVETTTTKSVYLCIITQKRDLLSQIKQSLSDKSKTV